MKQKVQSPKVEEVKRSTEVELPITQKEVSVFEPTAIIHKALYPHDNTNLENLLHTVEIFKAEI